MEVHLFTYHICICPWWKLNYYCTCICICPCICVFLRYFDARPAKPSDQLSAWWDLTYLRIRWKGHQVWGQGWKYLQPVLQDKVCNFTREALCSNNYIMGNQLKACILEVDRFGGKWCSTQDFPSCPREKALLRVKKRERSHVTAQNGPPTLVSKIRPTRSLLSLWC